MSSIVSKKKNLIVIHIKLMQHGFHIGNRRSYFTLPIGYAS